MQGSEAQKLLKKQELSTREILIAQPMRKIIKNLDEAKKKRELVADNWVFLLISLILVKRIYLFIKANL